MELIIDHRERIVIPHISGISRKIKTISDGLGDYQVLIDGRPKLYVERKTLIDLSASMKERSKTFSITDEERVVHRRRVVDRIGRQEIVLTRNARATGVPFAILVEGTKRDYESKFFRNSHLLPYSSVKKRILNMINRNVKIITTESANATGSLLSNERLLLELINDCESNRCAKYDGTTLMYGRIDFFE